MDQTTNRTGSARAQAADAGRRLVVALAARARVEGFDLCRIAPPELEPQTPTRLAAWLAEGRHADMDWMANADGRRAAPRALMPELRSIVMLGMNYGPHEDPREALARRSAAAISVYARHRDYHEVMKGRMKSLAGWLLREAAKGGEARVLDAKVFVDTAPVMEKPLAARAGLGWQGKHTNLVSRDFGSWLFLGAIFTTLDLPFDAEEADHCGSCRACLDACPTRAFPAPYLLDARRCISYLTIENKGPIPREFRAAMGNRIYGCDDCLAACPWNKFAEMAREAKLQARADLLAPPLAMLAALDEAGFRTLFSGSPVKRVGRDRFVRNVMVACGNSGDPALAESARARLADASPLVRGAAIWALSRLLARDRFAEEARVGLAAEADETVRAEWRESLDEAARGEGQG
ncbi:MAG: tRNA epoxyqueuosine(34) reductase QueG [Rhizobiales bacterium]|nr:tRNA epoxyqueuosine(34) reductase QueG [Hyphomicrobiales bacterium]